MASAWGMDGIEDGLSEMFRHLDDTLSQVRDRVWAKAASPSADEDTRVRDRDWYREKFRQAGKGRGPWGGGAAGPWAAWWPGTAGPPPRDHGPQADHGDVRAAILDLLQEGPRNGYQIMSDIAERSRGAWRPSPGAIYPVLSQLTDEGLIAAEESEGRRTYRLTDAGRDYLAQQPGQASGAGEQGSWAGPSLFAAAARLGSDVMQLACTGTREQTRAAEQLLEQTRRELSRILAGDDRGATAKTSAEPDTSAATETAPAATSPDTSAATETTPAATSPTASPSPSGPAAAATGPDAATANPDAATGDPETGGQDS